MTVDFDEVRRVGHQPALRTSSSAQPDYVFLPRRRGAGAAWAQRRRQVHAAGDRVDAAATQHGTPAVWRARRVAAPARRLRQRLGWLGHDLQLYPELTARENLTFFARLQGVTDVDARVTPGAGRCAARIAGRRSGVGLLARHATAARARARVAARPAPAAARRAVHRPGRPVDGGAGRCGSRAWPAKAGS